MPVLFYVHDPMCSWCWGYKPTFKKLIEALPSQIKLEYLVGGLAPDSDESMPQELRETISAYWLKIQNLLGTEFNFDFWTLCDPRRSTYPSCRAVLAAKQQGKEVEMIEAIQHAYYLRAMNPSDNETHIQLAKELDLISTEFEADLYSEKTEILLQEQISFTHSLPITGFPSLVLQVDNNFYPVPINYKSAVGTLKTINDYV